MLIRVCFSNETILNIISSVSNCKFCQSIAFRHWEAFDGIKFTQNISDQGCKDIADQLISENHFIDVRILI